MVCQFCGCVLALRNCWPDQCWIPEANACRSCFENLFQKSQIQQCVMREIVGFLADIHWWGTLNPPKPWKVRMAKIERWIAFGFTPMPVPESFPPKTGEKVVLRRDYLAPVTSDKSKLQHVAVVFAGLEQTPYGRFFWLRPYDGSAQIEFVHEQFVLPVTHEWYVGFSGRCYRRPDMIARFSTYVQCPVPSCEHWFSSTLSYEAHHMNRHAG